MSTEFHGYRAIRALCLCGEWLFLKRFDFSIDQSSGLLTAIGSPVATGTFPRSIAIDPAGRFAYVVNQTDKTVSSYTIDSNNGQLNPFGSPFTVEDQPISITIDPFGRYAY